MMMSLSWVYCGERNMSMSGCVVEKSVVGSMKGCVVAVLTGMMVANKMSESSIRVCFFVCLFIFISFHPCYTL